MDIECDQEKVGYLGTFSYSGLTLGNFLFSIISKYLMHKQIIIIFTLSYFVILFLTTFIANYYLRLIMIFLIGICQGMSFPSTLAIISESVSSKKRSLFASIVNVGYSTCPIMYTYIYVHFPNWKYVFWLQNIIAIICCILYTFILKNSSRSFFSKNKNNEAIEILKKIAKFNSKLDEFEENLKNEDYDFLSKNQKEEDDKNILLENKNKYGYSALFKYYSIRYKFIIFSLMWMIMAFLTNAIVINTKKMKGDFYINIITVFAVEIIGDIFAGFIINIPTLGRKKSLIGFYIGVALGFILYILFDKLEAGPIVSLFAMGIIRFSCAGVFTSYYVYFMESYPTQIRPLGFGLNQTLGNLAGSISPIIIEFFNEIIIPKTYNKLTNIYYYKL